MVIGSVEGVTPEASSANISGLQYPTTDGAGRSVSDDQWPGNLSFSTIDVSDNVTLSEDAGAMVQLRTVCSGRW